MMEFHISRQARDRYQFDQKLYSLSGNVIFADFHAVRLFAQKMNARRDLVNFPERAVRAGQINAMGLIDEILHLVVQLYREQVNPSVMEQALAWLHQHVGAEALQALLLQFAEEFPPLLVYRGEMTPREYLDGETSLPDGTKVPNRYIVLEELLMLWLTNANPAFAPFVELFDDSSLKKFSSYSQAIHSLRQFFANQPPFGPEGQNLIDMLRSPAQAVPHSLSGQLEYIYHRWGYLLGKYLYRLLSSLDFIKEEEKAIFGVGGQGPSYVYSFAGLEAELERFSPDRDWMPNLVLMAKNTYVWLDQLSKKYQRPITRLDQIPDEELDTLARWGMTGLWLIGLWERSRASRTIKQLCGNPEAVASAYSLFSYDIAADLGGEEAFYELRRRLWQRGIRLASDMVPNHVGIDSPWVIEHPDWFISLDYSPFPSYTFNGPNLSWDHRVGIYLEDHYYNHTDAAVVFKRVDFWTGSEKYIYHGNDGTSMPWNDTAQLNYLLPEVREAVIQTILSVARKFSIIRFDAAMTLAKRHYQRLWFPEPGSGGDIPSRAEHGMTKAEFDRLFPEEFWRQVVDRVTQEVPDTLLLAEAFWLMEGYFVRTLGMHRVYNSAFMNMLRDEKNQEYRLVIKNTLEFDPEILKRYVNFMNNPDERTAVDQFGKGDKYFGICTMMVTMPGLPMFGHGQVEGFTEKYGMEYHRAYWDEQPDGYLVSRHECEIFPLLHRRYLFAGVQNFLLYDFYTPEGYVNEDVFAYSNRVGEENALVIYHNRYTSTRGWIRVSAAFPVKTGDGEGRKLIQKSLAEGLGLTGEDNTFVIYRDHVSGLEYIQDNQQLFHKGMFIELGAYQYHVFMDFRQVKDTEDRLYAQLAVYLAGRGVPSIGEALKEILMQPIHTAFRELVNAGMLTWLVRNRPDSTTYDPQYAGQVLQEVEQKAAALLETLKTFTGGAGDTHLLAAENRRELEGLWRLLNSKDKLMEVEHQGLKTYLVAGPRQRLSQSPDDPSVWGTLLAWLFVCKLGKMIDENDYGARSRTWIDEWLLGKCMFATLQDLGLDEGAAWRSVGLVRLLCTHQTWLVTLEQDVRLYPGLAAYRLLTALLEDVEVQRFILVHRYQGILWFNKEAFEDLLWWLFISAGVGQTASKEGTSAFELLRLGYGLVERLLNASDQSGYQVERLLDLLRQDTFAKVGGRDE